MTGCNCKQPFELLAREGSAQVPVPPAAGRRNRSVQPRPEGQQPADWRLCFHQIRHCGRTTMTHMPIKAAAGLTLGALLALTTASRADDSAVMAQQDLIAQRMADPTHQQHVISAAARSTVMLQNVCPTAQYSIEKKFVPYQPVELDGSGVLIAGAWKQIVDLQGCGASRQLNVLVLAQGSKGVAVMPLLPGNTHADPVLQKDGVRFAVQATATVPGGHDPACKIGYVENTEYVAADDSTLPNAKGPGWSERWTLSNCTQQMVVPMHFIPDSTGTGIVAGPSDEIKVVPLRDRRG